MYFCLYVWEPLGCIDFEKRMLHAYTFECTFPSFSLLYETRSIKSERALPTWLIVIGSFENECSLVGLHTLKGHYPVLNNLVPYICMKLFYFVMVHCFWLSNYYPQFCICSVVDAHNFSVEGISNAIFFRFAFDTFLIGFVLFLIMIVQSGHSSQAIIQSHWSFWEQ